MLTLKTISRTWKEMYGENLREQYSGFYNKLKKAELEAKRPNNWVVIVNEQESKRYHKSEVKDNHLAFNGKIVLYTRGVAIKKARLFGGRAKMFKGELDPEKYMII